MVSFSPSSITSLEVHSARDIPTLAGRIRKQIPLSSIYTDQDGNTTCLYQDAIYGIIGRIWNRDGESRVFPRSSILNGLTQKPLDDRTISRIRTSDPYSFIVVCNATHTRLSLWPIMVAAAKGDQFHKELGFQDHHIFPREIFGGALTRWPQEQREKIERLRAAFLAYGIEQEYKDNYIPLPSHPTPNLAEAKQQSIPTSTYHCGKHENAYVMHMVDWANEFLKKNKGTPEQIRQKFWATVQTELVPRFQDGSISLGPKGREVLAAIKRLIANKEMQEKTQQHGLTESFNSCHPKNRMPQKPHTPPGQIGGVGLHAGEIENLFSDLESVFVTEHLIAIPTHNEVTPPFSIKQFHQLIHELKRGIYEHDTVPFFSLDFNKEGHLVPLLHPVYENTLVGKVFSLLDYFMKGFLNGGVFNEEFLLKWQAKKEKSGSALIEKIIDFQKYVDEQHCSSTPYYSLRQMLLVLQKHHQEHHEGGASFDLAALEEDSLHIKSSFRIIASQKTIQKHENLLLLDPDFEVLYTLEPDPAFRENVRQLQAREGVEPSSITYLREAYAIMCHNIKEEMPKLPLCKELFSMLGVISFLSHYLVSLKAHGFIPQVPQEVYDPVTTCPLFPALPLRTQTIGHFSFSFNTLYLNLTANQQHELEEWVYGEESASLSEQLKEKIAQLMQKQAKEQLPRPLAVACAQQESYEYFKEELVSILMDKFKKALLTHYGQRNFLTSLVGPRFSEQIESIKSIKVPFGGDVLALASELEERERLAIQNVVGGCGLRFAPKKAVSSLEAAFLFHHNVSTITTYQQNRWTPLFGKEPSKPAAFMCSIPFAPIDDDIELLSPYHECPSAEWEKALVLILQQNEDDVVQLTLSDEQWRSKDGLGRSLLHFAAGSNQKKLCDFLLRKGVRADNQDRHGQTPLHIAAAFGKLQALETLAAACHSAVNQADPQGQTPLHLAVRHNQLPCVRSLLQRDADILATTVDDMTPLLMALHHEYWPIVEELIPRSRRQFECCLSSGQSPLHEAVLSRNSTIVEKMCKQGAFHSPERKDGYTPLLLAAHIGEERIFARLLQEGASLTYTLSNGETVLHTAIQGGNIAIVQIIIEKEPSLLFELNHGQRSPLLQAVLLGAQPIACLLIETIKEQIEKSPEPEKRKLQELLHLPDDEHHTPLEAAIRLELRSTVDALWKLSVPLPPLDQFIPTLAFMPLCPTYKEIEASLALSIDHKKQLILTTAQQNNYELLDDLLAQVPDLPEEFLRPIFELCVQYNISDTAVELLEKHPIFYEQCYHGKGMLVMAAAYGHSFLLDYALEHPHTETMLLQAIEEACTHGHIAIVASLIEENFHLLHAPINQEGATPLHIAAKYGKTKLIDALIEHGSDVSDIDKSQRTALEYAVEASNEKNVRKLLRLQSPITMHVLLQAQKPEILIQVLEAKAWNKQELSQALFHAIEGDNESICSLLCKHGARSDLLLANNWTPLTFAASQGKVKSLSALLQEQDFLFHSAQGGDSLHHAVKNNQVLCIRPLLESGFNPTRPDSQGHTAIDLSKDRPWLMSFLTNPQEFEARLAEIEKEFESANPIALREKAIDFLHAPLFRSHFGKSCPLFLAALSQHKSLTLEIVQQYLHVFGESAHERDEEGNDLSHILAVKHLPPLPGFPPTTPNNQGLTALHFYAAVEEPEVLAQAIHALPSVDIQDKNGVSPLHIAVQSGYTKHVELLLHAHAQPNILTHDDISPLFLAVKSGNICMANLLFQANASIRVSRPSCLLAALSAGHEEMAFLLVRHGASLYDVDEKGNNAAHLATAKGLLSFLRYLNEELFSWSARNEDGLLPIHLGAKFGQSEAMRLVQRIGEPKEHTPPPPSIHACAAESGLLAPYQTIEQLKLETPLDLKQSPSILVHAVKSGIVDQLDRLLDSPVGDSIKELQFATLSAIARDDVKALEIIQSKGIPFDLPIEDNRTPLHWAADLESLQSVLFLLHSGVPTDQQDSKGNLPIHLALEHDNPYLLRTLVQHTPQTIREDKASYLHIAASHNCIQNCTFLLDCHVDINAQDIRRRTPLHEACAHGNSMLLELLLLSGADFEAETFDDRTGYTLIPEAATEAKRTWKVLVEQFRRTPAKSRLLIAIEQGYKRFLPLLVRIHDLESTNEHQETALHIAVRQKDHQLIQKLLQCEAPLERKDASGITPLWSATFLQDEESVRLLIAAGADINTTNKEGIPLTQAARELPLSHLIQAA